MRVLVTRPEPDGAELKAALEALGHEVSVEPLLTIEALPVDARIFDRAAAIIATSSNALRALAGGEALAAATELPIFTVGPATATLSRELGFTRVYVGEGSARDLVPIILASQAGERGPLVHIAGEEVAFDLAGALRPHGIEVRQVIAYRAVPAAALTPRTEKAIAEGALDAIVLMSPRTAEIFARLVKKARLDGAARQPAYICLSAKVATALAGAIGDPGPSRVNIAVKPNSSAILDAVGWVATHSSGV